MTLLEAVETQLQTVEDHVFYGAAGTLAKWNYIVFQRATQSANQDRLAKSLYINVVYVHENYIPENADQTIINAMTAIPGMRVSADDIKYDYTRKPGTDTIVEYMTIKFVKAIKR